MLRIRSAGIALLTLSAAGFVAAEERPPVKIDKPRLEAYVRYAEGYTPEVKIQADDPVPSPYPGILRVPVHVSLGEHRLDRIYYALPDGQRFLSGSVWDLGTSPFLDTLQRLPKDGPAFGPPTAKVTVVVFSDFQCPYCRQLATILRTNIPKKYPNDVRVVFADFPLDTIHKWARPAAEAAHCMTDGNAEAFWAFHDWIFEHQGEISETNLREKMIAYAQSKRMDTGKVGACTQSRATASEVEQSQKTGERLQVQETPTMFINGRLLNGARPWETLDSVIKLELLRPSDIALPEDGGAHGTDKPATLLK
jgi:protein-disulfide isomerase